MGLRRALVDRANADLREMGAEPDASKRAWLGGRAQALLSLANAIDADSPSTEDLQAKVDALLSKAAGAVRE